MKNFLLFTFTALIPFIVGGFGFLICAVSITIYTEQLALFIPLTLIFGAVFVVSIIQWRRFSRRCKKCKKWGVVNRTKKELTDGDSTMIEVKKENGNTKYVQGREYYLTKYYKCSHCGYSFSRTSKGESVERRY